ncbi:hypothetical protein YC2023_107079 [Brassica napus]
MGSLHSKTANIHSSADPSAPEKKESRKSSGFHGECVFFLQTILHKHLICNNENRGCYEALGELFSVGPLFLRADHRGGQNYRGPTLGDPRLSTFGLMKNSRDGKSYISEDATTLVELASKFLQSEAKDRPDTKFLLSGVAPLLKKEEHSPSSERRQMLKICAVMAQPMMPSDRIADGPNILLLFCKALPFMREMTSGRSEVEKFDGDGDYVLWKEKLLAHMELLGLLEGLEDVEVVDVEDSTAEKEVTSATEASVKPEEKILTDKALKEKRGKARSTIILSLGDHVLRKVIKEPTAADMLRMLDKLFMAKSLPNRIYLKQRLYGYKMSESMTMEENVNDFFKLISDLENVKVTVPDEDQAIVLLMSLPKQFDQLKETLKYGKTTLALDEITGAIRSKSLELGATGKLSKSSSEALYVQQRGRSDRRGKSSDRGKSQNRSQSRDKKTCWICGKDGHYKKQCFVWKERNKKSNSSEKGETSNVMEQVIDAAGLNVEEESNAVNDGQEDEWIMDTGCSFHMTPRRDWFVEFDDSKTGRVKMANQTYSEIKGIGSIRIQNEDLSTVLITNVRFVPIMSRNLISMGTLED